MNHLNLDSLSTLSGLAALVNFPTRGNSILDNCLTNRPELFNAPVPFKALIKTDHGGVILPPGNKLKPVRTKCSFRDFREHHKIQFTSLLQDFNWTHVTHATHIDSATKLFNETIHSMMDRCFPLRTVVMSTRDPPGLPRWLNTN